MVEVCVNVVDLIEKMRLLALDESYEVRLCAHETALADYSKTSGKILPRPKARGLLQCLLRHIKRPRPTAQCTLPPFSGENSSNISSASSSDDSDDLCVSYFSILA